MNRLFSDIVQALRAFFGRYKEGLPAPFKRLTVATNIGVRYTVLDIEHPSKICGLMSVDSLEMGDTLEVCVLVSDMPGKKKKLLRKLVLEGAQEEGWLYFEEHFYPSVMVTLEQTHGIMGRAFTVQWYNIM